MQRNLLLISDVSVFKDKQLFDLGYTKVSNYRKKKIDKYKYDLDKYLSLATELLLKYGFKLLNIDINLNDINYDNKPSLNNNYYFNFSHSGKYTICALSKNEVGIDIQEIKDFNINVAKRFFHENEYNKLLSLDLDSQKELFYDYFSSSEAFVKNIGVGMNLAFNEFEIIFDEKIKVRQNINNNEYYFRKYNKEQYVIFTCCRNDLDFEVIDVDLTDKINIEMG